MPKPKDSAGSHTTIRESTARYEYGQTDSSGTEV